VRAPWLFHFFYSGEGGVDGKEKHPADHAIKLCTFIVKLVRFIVAFLFYYFENGTG
jgi:hypothetical protein